MKIKKHYLLIIIAVSVFTVFYSCEDKATESDKPAKIENTLKSVSLLTDSVPTDPAVLLKSLEKINAVIDTIGYPNAGYKLWLLNSADSVDFKFMLEGYWPNQETYDLIHNHELYKNEMEKEKSVLEGLKNIGYYKFTKVK